MTTSFPLTHRDFSKSNALPVTACRSGLIRLLERNSISSNRGPGEMTVWLPSNGKV